MECKTARPHTCADRIGSGGINVVKLENEAMKREAAPWSHQGIVRSDKPHLLYCLVYGT